MEEDFEEPGNVESCLYVEVLKGWDEGAEEVYEDQVRFWLFFGFGLGGVEDLQSQPCQVRERCVVSRVLPKPCEIMQRSCQPQVL